MRLRVYKSVQAFNGAANALYWKNFTHLTVLKHQNTKTYIIYTKIIGLCTF